MALQVNGGGGGSGNAAIAAKGYAQPTLFTTPATANTMHIVTVTWGTSWSGSAAPTIVCIGVGAGYGAGGVANLIIKAGPSTPVNVSFGELSNAAGTIYWSYTYVSVLVNL